MFARRRCVGVTRGPANSRSACSTMNETTCARCMRGWWLLRAGARLFTARGRQQLAVLPLQGAYAAQRQHSLALLESLEERIHAIEQELEVRAQQDARVMRLRTHPGVGLLTGLAVVHALDPVQRFDRARRVAAYCGLDPKEHSSGDSQRFGHISKQGNRLLRFLLVEAAHTEIGRAHG